MNYPTVINELQVLDFGPEFTTEGGFRTVLPPRRGPSYELRVPMPGEDGFAMSGIRQMEVRAPLGTNVGWNVRAPGNRSPSLCTNFGSFIAFANTAAERQANGDPRESLEERYGDHAGFVEAVRHAADELVKERFLLQQDADAYIQAAEASDVLR